VVRTVWLALVFLIGICGVAALKVSIGTPTKPQVASGETTIGANFDQGDYLSKADKLEVPYVDETQDKKVVRIIPVEMPQAAQPKPPEKITKVISRHWHEGDAKIAKRPARNPRVTSRTKHRS
jgi:hypothetical protein